MAGKIIPRDKRFVTIADYQRLSGLSYATVSHMLKSGQLPYITTERGQKRVDTGRGGGEDNTAILERLNRQEAILTALCRHLGAQA